MIKKLTFDRAFTVVTVIGTLILTFLALNVAKHSDKIAEKGVDISKESLTISKNQAADHSAIDRLSKIEQASRTQIGELTDLVRGQAASNVKLERLAAGQQATNLQLSKELVQLKTELTILDKSEAGIIRMNGQLDSELSRLAEVTLLTKQSIDYQNMSDTLKRRVAATRLLFSLEENNLVAVRGEKNAFKDTAYERDFLIKSAAFYDECFGNQILLENEELSITLQNLRAKSRVLLFDIPITTLKQIRPFYTHDDGVYRMAISPEELNKWKEIKLTEYVVEDNAFKGVLGDYLYSVLKKLRINPSPN